MILQNFESSRQSMTILTDMKKGEYTDRQIIDYMNRYKLAKGIEAIGQFKLLGKILQAELKQRPCTKKDIPAMVEQVWMLALLDPNPAARKRAERHFKKGSDE